MKQISVNKTLLKVFIISFIAAFLMVLIPHLKTQTSKFISPYVKPEIMDKVQPLLEKTGNNFRINKPASLIPNVSASSDYDQASSYAVLDFNSGEVLASKNLSEKLSIASLTKIMTAVVALDLASSDEVFEVSENASLQIPTKVMLKPGEKYSLKELLSHLLISSANDSAQVILEGIDKKYELGIFIKAMNEKGKFLGLKNSHFTNAAGLDDLYHYSTAEDLAILTHLAMTKYPLIAQIVSQQIDDQTKDGSDMRFYLQNWNGLLGLYPGVRGVKIGNTGQAKYTTIVSSTRNNQTILAVLLGAPTVLARDLWTSKLLDLGFEKKGIESVNITEEQLKEKYSEWIYFR